MSFTINFFPPGSNFLVKVFKFAFITSFNSFKHYLIHQALSGIVLVVFVDLNSILGQISIRLHTI